ncbi:MAG: hypothetical protein DMG13_29305 [Acidobacteria bacterium]|nr:MAG: hypothetical protein DMG13_29305 [Acidobacteriota bacterium]
MIFSGRRIPAPVTAVFLISVSLSFATGKESFTVRSPAAWVDVANIQDAGETSKTSSGGVSTTLLTDLQTRVTERSTEHYVRLIRTVASQQDMEGLAQIQIDFEPSYQSLAIHHIRILRDGNVTNALRPADIQLLHREEELDQQIFNGTVQAVAILSDVRVGDVIDYAYTIAGDNPVMSGKYSGIVRLNDVSPVKRLRFRLLWPQKRALFIKKHNTDLEPKVTPGAETEYLWERRDIAPFESEDRVPGWFFASPFVELSEFQSWANVVTWAIPLFRFDTSFSADLSARIDAISKSSANTEQRLLAALRFVQDEVRYLGIELGEYSHQPTQPAKVLARRFGDCKDKALLLTVILRGLGIDAAPALVNTDSGQTLDARQPSPYAFNHAIVNVRLDGKTYWLDATRSLQRGSLKQFYNPDFARALVLRDGTQSLEDIHLAPLTEPTLYVKEEYRVESLTSPVAFTVTTTYTGPAADDVRYQLSRISPEKLGKQYLNFYAGDNPSVQALGSPKISDDEASNKLVVIEQYTITDFWKNSRHRITADRLVDEVQKPSISRRAMPLSVSYPLNIRQRIEFALPEQPDFSTDRLSFKDSTIQFEFSEGQEGKTFVLDYSLKTLRDHVPVNEIPSHLDLLTKIDDNLDYSLPMKSVQTDKDRSDAWNFMLFLTAAFAGGFGVRRIMMRRRRAIQTKSTSRLGEDPSTAITVTEDEQMLQHLLNVSCRCGKRFNLDKSPLREEALVYDGNRITVFRLQCPSCSADRDVYFKKASVDATT